MVFFAVDITLNNTSTQLNTIWFLNKINGKDVKYE